MQPMADEEGLFISASGPQLERALLYKAGEEGVSSDVMKFAEYCGGVLGHCVVQNGDGEGDVLGMCMMHIRISWLMDGVFDRAFVSRW
ncbi:hypothetical protein EYC80_004262 [Monilinia laxa]|uniref:Uncharacterized protein n=1 Tax=Monilinia laxa TaxID=61186 RepID=A0A5N6KMM1_MONLA|nr:hypothetical protein EYC80_004262 [Monilinia laxa]